MQMLNNRRGSSPIGIIVAVAAAALVAGGIWYYVSKPFQTHVNQSFSNATEWTSENIRKDPDGYLTWALAEVGKTEDKFKDAKLSLTKKKLETQGALRSHTAEKSDCETYFGELKEAFKIASEKTSWPVKVRQRSFNQDALKNRIVECSHEIDNKTKLVETYASTDKRIEDKLAEVNTRLSDIDQLKAKLSADKEIAQVNQSVDDIESIGGRINSIKSTTTALASISEEGTSVAQDAKPSGEAKVDEEFSKIMGKTK